ncbi:MAG: 50S ribosomal protein L4 [Verrucomicrobia bacterium]|nr:50S ribosomal protein L4 [Verrucomicrobiota bacterium]
MKLPVKDIQGKEAGEFEVKFPLIENHRGTQAVHDVVTAYRANQRLGTACTKTVGEVRGSNKKPWRQKGTGRARAGSFQSPLWRGGGVVFGPRPRDFSKKVNAKVKNLALQKAFSSRLIAGDVIVVDDLKLAAPKTKEFLGVLKALELTKTLLVVVPARDEALLRASRNVPGVELTTSDDLNTYQVLWPNKLLFTKGALEKMDARLTK